MRGDITDELLALMANWTDRSRKAYSQPGQRDVSAAIEQCRTEIGKIVDRDPRRAQRKQPTTEDLASR